MTNCDESRQHFVSCSNSETTNDATMALPQPRDYAAGRTDHAEYGPAQRGLDHPAATRCGIARFSHAKAMPVTHGTPVKVIQARVWPPMMDRLTRGTGPFCSTSPNITNLLPVRPLTRSVSIVRRAPVVMSTTVPAPIVDPTISWFAVSQAAFGAGSSRPESRTRQLSHGVQPAVRREAQHRQTRWHGLVRAPDRPCMTPVAVRALVALIRHAWNPQNCWRARQDSNLQPLDP